MFKEMSEPKWCDYRVKVVHPQMYSCVFHTNMANGCEYFDSAISPRDIIMLASFVKSKIECLYEFKVHSYLRISLKDI